MSMIKPFVTVMTLALLSSSAVAAVPARDDTADRTTAKPAGSVLVAAMRKKRARSTVLQSDDSGASRQSGDSSKDHSGGDDNDHSGGSDNDHSGGSDNDHSGGGDNDHSGGGDNDHSGGGDNDHSGGNDNDNDD